MIVRRMLMTAGLSMSFAGAACKSPENSMADVAAPRDSATAEDTSVSTEDVPATEDSATESDASPPDATPPEDAATPSEGEPRGEIVVSEGGYVVDGVTSYSRAINAAFGTYPRRACTERREGACTVRRCTYASSDEQSSSPTTKASAGDITATVGSATTFTMRPDAELDYGFFADGGPARRWAAGDAVTITAAGATVPAFSFTGAIPAVVDGTVGELAAGETNQIAIDRTSALSARWTATGAPGDVVHVVVSQGTSRGGSVTYPRTAVTVRCVYATSAGTASIPPTVLADLVTDDRAFGSHVDTSAWVEGTSLQTVSAGAYTIALSIGSGSAVHRDATVR